MFENISTKIKISLLIYKAVIYIKSLFIIFQLLENSFFKLLRVKPIFVIQIKLS